MYIINMYIKNGRMKLPVLTLVTLVHQHFHLKKLLLHSLSHHLLQTDKVVAEKYNQSNHK